MGKLIKGTFLTIIVSFFIFPAEFTFLPTLFNSKNLLAAVGALAYFYDSIWGGGFRLSRRTFISAIIAIIFSIWCLYSVTVNGTDDNTYINYWSSFLLWILAAYAVYFMLRISNGGKVSLGLVVKYMAIVGVAQCVLALMIDNIGPVKRVVDAIFVGGDYYSRTLRLYGIGCALDQGGCRLSVIQVLIAHLIGSDNNIRSDNRLLGRYLIAFIVITVVGSMISRTTLAGSILGLVYIVFSIFMLHRGGFISKQQTRLFLIFLFLLIAAITFSIGLYRINAAFRSYIRFGFEAFFNWAETGELRTGSTDTLLTTMWIWPHDPHGWTIGYGRIGVFEWGTDVGYCNFTLYCGLIGVAVFSLFFIYNHFSLVGKFRSFLPLALVLTALTFIIWAKVTTDIFFIDALLFCIDEDKSTSEEIPVPNQ